VSLIRRRRRLFPAANIVGALPVCMTWEYIGREAFHLDSRAGTLFLGRSALVWTRDYWIACLRGLPAGPRKRQLYRTGRRESENTNDRFDPDVKPALVEGTHQGPVVCLNRRLVGLDAGCF
jgi:hypothetical protein